jgi:carbon storage regulator
MLVLARRPSEAIKIGDSIIIKVISIRGGQVKLGIEAPSGLRVVRTEVSNGSGSPSQGSSGKNGGEPSQNSGSTQISPVKE